MIEPGQASKDRADQTRKVALFGGTFDPIHDGHIFIASEAQRLCGLDEVIFVPCWQSPHKPERRVTESHHRVEMTRLAVADLPWAKVSDFEAARSEPSYSWQTAQHFTQSQPNSELFWLLGVDQWQVIDQWSHPEILAELLTFIVFGRNGLKPEAKPRFRHVFLPGTIDFSATEIRAFLAKNTVPPGLDARVIDYVRRHKLYSEGGA